MATDLNTAEIQQVWDSFDRVRDHLFRQFKQVPYALDSGLPLEGLEWEVEAYLASNGDQPRVIQKANVYRIVMTRGQIYVDPADWFADKINHGGILRKLTLGSYYDQKYSRGLWLDEAVRGPLAEGAAWFEQAREIGLAHGERGGYAVQFNVFNAETLRDAQRNPERYASLQIRVTGWSVYFTSMPREERDQYIARFAHSV